MPDLSKVPAWAWVVGAVGIGAALYLYKKHKEQSESSTTNNEATSASSEVLPEPYPYSYGAGAGEGFGGGGGAIGSASEQPFTELFGTFMQSQREMSQEQQEQQKSFLESILESNRTALEAAKNGGTIPQGSSGGAPSSGTGTVGAPPTQAAHGCPSGYLQNGSVASPHTCYKITTKSMTGPKGAKATCECHTYQDGHNECQHVANGRCAW